MTQTGNIEAFIFALPPLTLHTLRPPSQQTTFFNFLASHDGIGLNPARGLLLQNDIDALNRPAAAEPLAQQVARFLAAQAIMLSFVGVPGVYFHSLFGSRGWPEGVAQTARNRSINRQKCDRAELERELARPGSLRRKVFTGYQRLLNARARSRAFHPYGLQRVLDYGDSVFALLRLAPGSGERVLYLQNVTQRSQAIPINLEEVLGLATMGGAVDLLTRERFSVRRKAPRPLEPYQSLWLIQEK